LGTPQKLWYNVSGMTLENQRKISLKSVNKNKISHP
jgi:hypothetical protein